MFPDTIMGAENDIIDKVPGATSIKGKVDGMMSKLPKLEELTAMITGGVKDEDVINAKNGSGSVEETNMENLLAIDVDAVSKKAENISSEASYEETSGETIIVKSGSEQDVDVETGDNKESLTPVLVSTGSNDSEVSDLLYKGS